MNTASRRARALICLPGIAILLATAGCASLDYYGQAVRGQIEILGARRAVPAILADPVVPAATKRRLEVVSAMRDFARRELGLTAGGSFRTYADLHRDYAVWSVFAAPEFSLEPVRSCFPFAGCLAYRGFFRQDAAAAYAAMRRARGYDVYVGGVAAYSTLGWFDDPILNTWLGYDPPRLAMLVFHELAHALIYAKNDSTFNEGFATAVAQIGYTRWEAAHGAADGGVAALLNTREDQLMKLLLGYRERFAALYASGRPPPELRAEKQRLFDLLAADYAALQGDWGGDRRFDAWMSTDMNNAKLASVVTYHEFVPGFLALYERCGRDLPRFYAAVRALAGEPRAKRRPALRELAGGSGTCRVR